MVGSLEDFVLIHHTRLQRDGYHRADGVEHYKIVVFTRIIGRIRKYCKLKFTKTK